MSTINVRKVPEELHREAKVQAAREGKPLQDWIIEAIKEKLERSERSNEAAPHGARTPNEA